MSVKNSTLPAQDESTTHQLLSHYPFTGTFTGTKMSQNRMVHDRMNAALAGA
jgi:hypothetical protein